ncbi:MAG: gluconate 2-dehydrogenase subunit 3 family protein [Kangiellaceae bacterium]|nr:gluconate 2-dehydrogenase subunit 3 family protein [Kangiellaceae bacterium]MCW8999250.1 gluconate 2-dehydrogenase subunit 3 family protein [Kangiellaceae bacterium]
MKQTLIDSDNPKRGSTKKEFQGNLQNGLNRRAFLKTGGAASILVALAGCKPEVPEEHRLATVKEVDSKADSTFDDQQKAIIEAVQQHLFPDDGDGPDAKAINAFDYLEFAMTDPQNIKDGDPDFIVKGVGWLQDLADQTQGDSFLKLPHEKQAAILKQISGSSAGENWLSLLLYYLTEALLLDPIYGGNPDEIAWQWLEHQAGFPRPVAGKTYRDFE